MKFILAALLFASSAFATTSVVEGTIDKMVPEHKEIYVLSGGERYEYYFKPHTKIQRQKADAAGTEATYQDLKKGMKVKVTAEKKGKRLDPQTVEIME